LEDDCPAIGLRRRDEHAASCGVRDMFELRYAIAGEKGMNQ
jgi:hypothetical protein